MLAPCRFLIFVSNMAFYLSMRFIALLAIVLCSTIGFSQNSTLSGTIISEKGEPLPYANLKVKNHNLGTISNGEGAFKLIVPTELTSDSLLITFIGFKTKTIKISEWTDGTTITLNQNSIDLAEVKITALSAEAILAKALKNVKSNYNQEAHKAEGFYRVTSKRDTNIIHLSEAVFELYQSQNDRPHEQLRLKKVRAIKDKKGSEGMDLGLSPRGIYSYDIVMHPDQLDLLTKKGMRKHAFDLIGSELVQGQLAYKIEFDQIGDEFSGYKGTMYIDKESFAFVHFNVGYSPKGIANHKYGDFKFRTALAIMGLEIKLKRNELQISYQKSNGKYYLNTVINDAQMYFASEEKEYEFDADIRVDYLVTKIQDKAIKPFDSEEVAKKNRLLQSKAKDYSTQFWDDFNIILPTDDYESIAKRIADRNNAD